MSLGWPEKSRLWRSRPGKRVLPKTSTKEVGMQKDRSGARQAQVPVLDSQV